MASNTTSPFVELQRAASEFQYQMAAKAKQDQEQITQLQAQVNSLRVQQAGIQKDHENVVFTHDASVKALSETVSSTRTQLDVMKNTVQAYRNSITDYDAKLKSVMVELHQAEKKIITLEGEKQQLVSETMDQKVRLVVAEKHQYQQVDAVLLHLLKKVQALEKWQDTHFNHDHAASEENKVSETPQFEETIKTTAKAEEAAPPNTAKEGRVLRATSAEEFQREIEAFRGDDSQEMPPESEFHMPVGELVSEQMVDLPAAVPASEPIRTESGEAETHIVVQSQPEVRRKGRPPGRATKKKPTKKEAAAICAAAKNATREDNHEADQENVDPGVEDRDGDAGDERPNKKAKIMTVTGRRGPRKTSAK